MKEMKWVCLLLATMLWVQSCEEPTFNDLENEEEEYQDSTDIFNPIDSTDIIVNPPIDSTEWDSGEIIINPPIDPPVDSSDVIVNPPIDSTWLDTGDVIVCPPLDSTVVDSSNLGG